MCRLFFLREYRQKQKDPRLKLCQLVASRSSCAVRPRGNELEASSVGAAEIDVARKRSRSKKGAKVTWM